MPRIWRSGMTGLPLCQSLRPAADDPTKLWPYRQGKATPGLASDAVRVHTDGVVLLVADLTYSGLSIEKGVACP